MCQARARSTSVLITTGSRQIVFKSPVQSGFLAPKQRNRTKTSPRKFPRPSNWQLDRKKPVLNGPYISCNQLQPVF